MLKKIHIFKPRQHFMEEGEMTEENTGEFSNDEEYIRRIEERIWETAGRLRLDDESLGHAFLQTSPHMRIELINRISKLLDLMKDYVDSELAALNTLHSKIK
jgi:hypothetical protein